MRGRDSIGVAVTLVDLNGLDSSRTDELREAAERNPGKDEEESGAQRQKYARLTKGRVAYLALPVVNWRKEARSA